MFKVGDKVVAKSDEVYRVTITGVVCTVTEVGSHSMTVLCSSNNRKYYVDMDYFKYCNVRNTKLARKMYPEHKILDKDWIQKFGGKND